MDIYLQMIQVVQYKHYLKKCNMDVRKKVDDAWVTYVNDKYEKGYYF